VSGELNVAAAAMAVVLALAGIGTTARAAQRSGASDDAQAVAYQVVSVQNPVYRPNELFPAQEDITSPRFEEVRNKYRLDEVIAGGQDEFTRILLLRQWVHKQLVVDRSKPVPGNDALAYLAEGPKGAAYSCGHHMIALNAVLNAMGYVTRCLNAGPGGKEGLLTGHHGMCEVWSNDLRKWVIVDSEHDAHFEKDGVPLSALEIRDEVIRNGGTDVFRVDGPGRKPQPRERDESWGRTPRTYNFVGWMLSGNVHSSWPQQRSSVEVVYDDEYWRNHTWFRGGKEHWAYKAGYFLPIRHRAWIEWTPNVLRVKTAIKGNVAQVSIASCTPNLKEYQMKSEGGNWEAVGNTFSLQLSKPRHEWRLRSVNVMNVPGPEYRLVIQRQ